MKKIGKNIIHQEILYTITENLTRNNTDRELVFQLKSEHNFSHFPNNKSKNIETPHSLKSDQLFKQLYPKIVESAMLQQLVTFETIFVNNVSRNNGQFSKS